MKALDLDITKLSINEDCFIHSNEEKKQIIIHATGSALSAPDYLNTISVNKEQAPAFVIDRNGKVLETYGIYGSSKMVEINHPYFINSIDKTNEKTNNCAIHIAIANAGPLLEFQHKFYPLSADGIADVKQSPVTDFYEYCPKQQYYNYTYYEMITDKQINSLKRLLLKLIDKIGMTYHYDNQLGTICYSAIRGRSGIYFASSYDKRRSDIHPQTNLLRMLKLLNS